MAVIQQTLKEALDYAQLSELPQEGEPNGGWSHAIALVKRSVGGVESYAIAEKRNGGVSITHDFGMAYQCSGLKGIDKVYPFGNDAQPAIAREEQPSYDIEEAHGDETTNKESEEESGGFGSLSRIAMEAAERDGIGRLKAAIDVDSVSSASVTDEAEVKQTIAKAERGRPKGTTGIKWNRNKRK